MRVPATMAAILLVQSMATERVEAQVQFGAALSWGSETDLGLGGRLNFGLGELTKKSKIEGRVAADYFFPNGFNYWQIAGDAFTKLRPQDPFGEARFQFGNGSQVVLAGGVTFGR